MIQTSFGVELGKGKIKVHHKTKWDEMLQKIKPGFYQLKIKKPQKTRTEKENKYYWGVVVKMIGDELGYTQEEAHEALKHQFLREEQGKLSKVRSTADLSTTEFEQYLEQVRIFALVELNIKIPLPNEVD